jgi:hypothetical protein
MPQQLLHRPDVATVLERVRRKRMPKAVTTRPLGQSRSTDGGGHGLLDDGLVQMKTGRWTSSVFCLYFTASATIWRGVSASRSTRIPVTWKASRAPCTITSPRAMAAAVWKSPARRSPGM